MEGRAGLGAGGLVFQEELWAGDTGLLGIWHQSICNNPSRLKRCLLQTNRSSLEVLSRLELAENLKLINEAAHHVLLVLIDKNIVGNEFFFKPAVDPSG